MNYEWTDGRTGRRVDMRPQIDVEPHLKTHAKHREKFTPAARGQSPVVNNKENVPQTEQKKMFFMSTGNQKGQNTIPNNQRNKVVSSLEATSRLFFSVLFCFDQCSFFMFVLFVFFYFIFLLSFFRHMQG